MFTGYGRNPGTERLDWGVMVRPDRHADSKRCTTQTRSDSDARLTQPTPDTIASRLLDAVEVLCAEVAPSAVTMRMIAAEADLSLGVAYNHFDSRDALFGAALDRMAERIMLAVAGEDPIAAIPALWKEVADNPAFPRLVTSFAIGNRLAPDLMAEDPLMHRVMQASAATGMDDPETIAAVTGILVLAGAVFAPTLNRAVGRSPDDPRAQDAIAAMYGVWIDALSAKEPDA